MARVTVEDCLNRTNNRFGLVILAAERARQISKGSTPLIDCVNKPPVTALREIASGKVQFKDEVRSTIERYLADQRARGLQPQQ